METDTILDFLDFLDENIEGNTMPADQEQMDRIESLIDGVDI